MLTMRTDLMLAAVSAALVVAVWILARRRKSQPLREDVWEDAWEYAWPELRQQCLDLAEQDELSGANAEELHRAAERYHNAVGEAPAESESGRQLRGATQVHRQVALLQ